MNFFLMNSFNKNIFIIIIHSFQNFNTIYNIICKKINIKIIYWKIFTHNYIYKKWTYFIWNTKLSSLKFVFSRIISSWFQTPPHIFCNFHNPNKFFRIFITCKPNVYIFKRYITIGIFHSWNNYISNISSKKLTTTITCY